MNKSPKLLLKNIAALILFVGLAIIFSTACAKADYLSVKNFIGQPSVETFPVDVEINHVHLRIPRNYLEWATKNKDGSIFLNIKAHFPDFAGATDETIYQFHSAHLFKSPDMIEIVTENPSVTADNFHQTFIKDENNFPKHEKKYGLNVAQKPIAEESYYTDGLSAKDRVLINCNQFGNNSPKRCEQRLDITTGIKIICQYDASLLPQWKSINDQIYKLFQSFTIGE